MVDGDETDLDCGGSCPTRCAPGQACSTTADCDAGVCLPAKVCGQEGLTLTSDRGRLVALTGVPATVVATLVGDGAPLAGREVRFSVDDFAELSAADGGSGPTATAVTDSLGRAHVAVVGVTAGGNATVSADADAQHASIVLRVSGVQEIVFESTTCGGAGCSVLGVKGSGFHESAVMAFEVLDTDSMPVPGDQVNFSLTNPPPGIQLTTPGITDAAGRVTTTISTGPAIGSFTVHASTTPSGGASTDSPTIQVAGAKATNRGIWVGCSTVNVAAYAAAVPPAVYSVPCMVSLSDRYSNPIGTGAPVFLHVEAGVVPYSVATSVGMNVGSAGFNFSTAGAFPPVDVAPLAADPAQPYPGPRTAEPYLDGGSNPRDGLVTLLAYTAGEEWFDDLNVDGVHDNGEPFVDQGEPLVDSNDDGVWEPGELFVDSNGNSQWDGPNGVWDGQTTIWADLVLLYSGLPVAALASFSPPDYGACPAGVPKGSSTALTLGAPDGRLNQVEAASTVTLAHTADAGTLTMPPVLDGYGFGTQRVLLNANGDACAVGTDPICTFKRVFTTWGAGQLPPIRVDGAPAGSTNACIDDTLTVTVTTRGAAQQFSTTGAIQ